MRKKVKYILACAAIAVALVSCGIYSFNDASIPPEVRTIKVGYIQNRAQYINPQLSPKLTDAFIRKLTQQTKLRRVEDNSADYVIEAEITNYMVTTSGVSQNQAATNRLSVGVHITHYDNHLNKVNEHDISRDFDFPASQSLTQAEAQLMDKDGGIVKTITDEIFNKIFSNW